MKKKKEETSQLDFEITCIWRDQLKYRIYQKDQKEFAEVPMESGRTALYEMTSERYNYVFEDTGQKNFKFKFVKFIREGMK